MLQDVIIGYNTLYRSVSRIDGGIASLATSVIDEWRKTIVKLPDYDFCLTTCR